MKTVHPPMTGLELRFENELKSLPHWQAWIKEPSRSRKRKPHPKQPNFRDQIMEEVMVLGR